MLQKNIMHKNVKFATDFMGELNDIATSDTTVISYAEFDILKIYPVILLKNKYIRMSCKEDKLEFYEMYQNKKTRKNKNKTKTKTIPTLTPKTSYSEYSFKGVIGNKYYLGVPDLSTISKIEILNSSDNPYYTWIFDSTSSPSFMYLVNSKNGKQGKKSNYCLDINDPYIFIVNCANTKHKFKYGGEEYSSVFIMFIVVTNTKISVRAIAMKTRVRFTLKPTF
ncbi:hypothetical protein U3516DRAFT_836749 [Neocallimastix sp. 'constans']